MLAREPLTLTFSFSGTPDQIAALKRLKDGDSRMVIVESDDRTERLAKIAAELEVRARADARESARRAEAQAERDRIADAKKRARLAVIEMCPSNECRIREECTRCAGSCRLRPPLDEIAQSIDD